MMLHPCFSEEAHFKVPRLHLPVAYKCNIQCIYCSRSIDSCALRPGVAFRLLSPKEALELVKSYLKREPHLKVVGVAGPGEPLFNRETFDSLRLIHERYPHLIKCVATNGLLLPSSIELLKEVGVRSVTVTINTVRPDVATKIYLWVAYGGQLMRGVKACEGLIEKQLEGVERAAKAGLLVKVNFVLMPDINARCAKEVAREVARRGAVLMNIMPLIPLHVMKDLRPPTCEELRKAREEAERYIPQFRLCKQCRADAAGIPGAELFASSIQREAWLSIAHG
jgi:nitrogen fixation protein NifB